MRNLVEFVGGAFVHVTVALIRAIVMAGIATVQTFCTEFFGEMKADHGNAHARPYRRQAVKAR